MPITFNSALKNRQLFSALSSIDLTVDCGSGSNRLLVAIVIQRGVLRTISSVTYNSVSLSLAINFPFTVIANEAISIYYLVAPSTGSNTLNVTFTGGTQNQCELIGACFEGVLQSSPLDQTNSNEGTSTSPTVSVTPTTDGQLVVGAVLHEHITALSGAGGETSLYDTDQGAWVTSSAYAIQTTAGAQAVDWTAGASETWGAVAASFKPALAAGGLFGAILPVRERRFQHLLVR